MVESKQASATEAAGERARAEAAAFSYTGARPAQPGLPRPRVPLASVPNHPAPVNPWYRC